MSTALGYAALGCVLAGLLAGAVALLATRDAGLTARVLLDLWLAATLLQLAGDRDLGAVLAVAVVLGLREVFLSGRRWTRPGAGPPAPR